MSDNNQSEDKTKRNINKAIVLYIQDKIDYCIDIGETFILQNVKLEELLSKNKQQHDQICKLKEKLEKFLDTFLKQNAKKENIEQLEGDVSEQEENNEKQEENIDSIKEKINHFSINFAIIDKLLKNIFENTLILKQKQKAEIEKEIDNVVEEKIGINKVIWQKVQKDNQSSFEIDRPLTKKYMDHCKQYIDKPLPGESQEVFEAYQKMHAFLYRIIADEKKDCI